MDVEIWSDVVCPWCYIGKRRFEAALADFPQRDEVNVTWRSFELDGEAPRERDVDGATHLAQKYGMSREEAVARRQQVSDLATGEGLDFDHDIARSGNTFDAHRLLHLAAEHGKQDALKGRLMRAYHAEGEPIGDPETLERLAIEVGLPQAEVHEVLSTDRYAEDVRSDEATASMLGITGVPFFVVDRKFAASGAQPPEVLLRLLTQAQEASTAHGAAAS